MAGGVPSVADATAGATVPATTASAAALATTPSSRLGLRDEVTAVSTGLRAGAALTGTSVWFCGSCPARTDDRFLRGSSTHFSGRVLPGPADPAAETGLPRRARHL